MTLEELAKIPYNRLLRLEPYVPLSVLKEVKDYER